MSRNHYTKLVRKGERALLAHQEKQLVQLVRQLRCGIAESPVVPLIGAKDRRSARLIQKRRHKPAHTDHPA